MHATPRTRAPRLAALVAVLAAATGDASASTVAMDRQWDRLPAPGDGDGRATLAAAADALGERLVHLAGVPLDARRLAELADVPRGEPLVRHLRERLGRPVDPRDLMLFLDDLVARGPPGEAWLPSGRARAAGILLHPDDVFGPGERRYGDGRLALFEPAEPADLEPAPDGAPLGPCWTARYRNPADEAAMLDALRAHGGADFAGRIEDLLRQFREQGAEAYVFSTVRSRERGYLMYGAFILARAGDRATVERRVAELDRLNREWGLDVPIRWSHPDGWRATVDAAEAMAEAYNVVYATRRGARYSSHYGAGAADFAAIALPRELTLRAPDGAVERFDLSAPDEPRDLNLTPRLIRWVEAHFALDKLRSDYPHWTDARDDD